MHINKEYVSEALNAGVKGYLAKTCSASDLVSAIKEVAAGKIYLSPTISHTLHKLISTPLQSSAAVPATPPPPPVDHNLSKRELEVLKLLAEGNNTKEIASSLQISPKTVETYRYNLMKKLGIVNVAGLVKYAIRNMIINMD
jgi:DNA-binding NarL/FixJ family response regulator